MIIYSVKPIKKDDWIFIAKSKVNNVPLAVSAYHYSSMDDCVRAAKGMAQDHVVAKIEVEEVQEAEVILDSRVS